MSNSVATTSHDFNILIVTDSDSDGLYDYKETNTGIYVSTTNTGTDPLNNDSDSDGLNDYDEIYSYSTNPNESDTDFDGLSDFDELNTYLTDPLLNDTSGDGLKDGEVVDSGFDPSANYTNLKNLIIQGVQDLRAGSTMIEVENGQATLSMELEESDDLEIWTSGSTTTFQVPADSDTKFYRFKMAD